MHRLLVPLDGSPASNRALEHVIELAKSIRPFHVHLLSVHELPHDYGRSAAYFPAEHLAEMAEQHSREVLDPAVARLKAAGIDHSVESTTGDVAHAVVECAQRNACDTIVMGTRGMGTIGSLVLGSVAVKVVHLADMPVMLVK
ncbi:MAG: universal stress protein [Nitratireductor sp.]|jgi:nucleotide-binding universal stress UspA family protein|nr:universal stress protein [Nitratireductor sp.]